MASSVIRLICPNLKCRTLLCAPAQARGKMVRCSACGMKVHVPATPVNVPAPASASDEETVG